VALLFRVDQSAEFVSVEDTDFDSDKARKVSPLWAYASGQPEGCTRFRVRPLSTDEMQHFASAETEAGDDADAFAEVQRSVVRAAVLAVDGQAPDVDAMAVPMVMLLCSLVFAATQHPLAALHLPSTEGGA